VDADAVQLLGVLLQRVEQRRGFTEPDRHDEVRVRLDEREHIGGDAGLGDESGVDVPIISAGTGEPVVPGVRRHGTSASRVPKRA
jgi:hypothetical protein